MSETMKGISPNMPKSVSDNTLLLKILYWAHRSLTRHVSGVTELLYLKSALKYYIPQYK